MPRHQDFDISKRTFSSGNLKDTTRIGGMQLTIMPLGDGAKNQFLFKGSILLPVDVASCCKFKSERGVSRINTIAMLLRCLVYSLLNLE